MPNALSHFLFPDVSHHRVTHPVDEMTKSPKYSIPFYFNPPWPCNPAIPCPLVNYPPLPTPLLRLLRTYGGLNHSAADTKLGCGNIFARTYSHFERTVPRLGEGDQKILLPE